MNVKEKEVDLLHDEVDLCTFDNVFAEFTLSVDDKDFALERRVGVEGIVYQLEDVVWRTAFLDGCWGGSKGEGVVDGGGRDEAECAGQGEDD